MSKSTKILDAVTAMNNKLDIIMKRLDKLEKTQKSPVKSIKKSTPVISVGPVNITEFSKYILITGDTFDIKAEFKKVGGKWDGDNKGWRIIRTRISDYEDFKKDLKNKSSKLNIKTGKEKNTDQLPEDNTYSSTLDNIGCMISSSDDEY